MKSISLVFALHNHQPVGNFDHVIENAYDQAYKPFLDVLEAHPRITVALHVTGCLGQWIAGRHPDYFERLRALFEAGRLEMLTGAYYEPILPIIPRPDAIGQIRKLTEFVRDKTGAPAKGMWLAERVWEPQLPSIMRESGVDFSVLDDSHFFASGLTASDIFGYYMTEDAGQAVAVFPAAEKLRYTIPFGKVEDTIEWLREQAVEGGKRLAVFADDGEKFGVWPQTHEHVYDDGWLDDFFTALEDNGDWLKMTTFSRALEAMPPLGRVYLPTASYIEMMTWALPARSVAAFEKFRKSLKTREDFKTLEPFIRGGFWRNFLSKYEESNHLHKRMLRVSAVAHAALDAASGKASRQAEETLDLVWQGQCNCAYWHGVFGGLYLPHLRSSLYERFIAADALLRARSKSAQIERVDFDGDGLEEVIIETPALSLYFTPSIGGALVELDDLRTRVNACDTLTRRQEAYHAKVAEAVTWDAEPEEKEEAAASIHDIVRTKEAGLERLLVFDWYRRASCLARFIAGWTTLEDFAAGRYAEDGDFVNQPFEIEAANIRPDGSAEVVLVRRGGLYQGGGAREFLVRRTIAIAPQMPVVSIAHEVQNLSALHTEALFGVEFAINFLAPDAVDRYAFIPGKTLTDPRLGAIAEEQEVAEFGLADEWRDLRLTFTLSEPATLWRLPIETISNSEAGFERVHQGACLLPLWPLRLDPGETRRIEMELALSSARTA